MDKETAEKKLKYEIELLKIYSFFIAATATGVSTLLLRGKLAKNDVEMFLFLGGFLIFAVFVYHGFFSFISVKRLIKKL